LAPPERLDRLQRLDRFATFTRVLEASRIAPAASWRVVLPASQALATA
jgi:hypothetical protein